MSFLLLASSCTTVRLQNRSIICFLVLAPALEELEEERQRRKRATEEVKIKEEPQEIELQKEKSASLDGQHIRAQSLEHQKEELKEHEGSKNSLSLLYKQPSCVSKLCTLRDSSKDVGKESMKTEEKESSHVRTNGSPNGPPVPSKTGTTSSHVLNIPEPAAAAFVVTTNDPTNIPPPASTSLSFPSLPAPRDSPGNTPPTSSPAPSPHFSFQANDQLLRVLTERSGHWFSLLPRNPCDLSSLTTTPPGVPRGSPQASSTPGRPRSPPPSPALPLTPSAASASASPHHPAGLLNYPLSALQVSLLTGSNTLPLCLASPPSTSVTVFPLSLFISR